MYSTVRVYKINVLAPQKNTRSNKYTSIPPTLEEAFSHQLSLTYPQRIKRNSNPVSAGHASARHSKILVLLSRIARRCGDFPYFSYCATTLQLLLLLTTYRCSLPVNGKEKSPVAKKVYLFTWRKSSFLTYFWHLIAIILVLFACT